jgi:ABC-type lipoprotein export system ATPase subunit
VMDILTWLNKEWITIILITHDNHIATYAQKIIRIKDGEIETSS